ncbi:MAG: TerB family tellurite resistance protein, partial [Gammaproteobacteria bacterium]
HFDYAEKVQLVMNMWEVAFADGKIDRYEEHLIRKVAELLYLDHKDFILSKQRAREASGAD